MFTPDEFYALLTKYTDDKCTEREEAFLFSLIESGKYDDILSRHFEASLLSENTSTSKISPIRAEEIMERILRSERQTVSLISGNKKKVSAIRYWWVAAASIAIICFGAYFYFGNSTPAFSLKEVASLKNAPQLKENKSSRPLPFLLEDGSKIVLEAGSSLSYPQNFLSDKREVYLQGEASFQISKSPGRPFFVYHNNLVTQVLGTSFNIKVDKNSDAVEIDVITGRVQVSEWKNMDSHSEKDEGSGVILTPNQKTVYNNQRRQFVTSLVDIPLPVAKDDSLPASAKQSHLIYENTSLPEVLAVLEAMYKVEIIMESDNLNNCLFTGDLSDPNLFVNLDLIATVINAAYEVKGTNILLKGKGCI